MTISSRLDKEVEKKIEILSKLQGISKSKVISNSILEYFESHFPANYAYAIGKDLFGKYGSGKKDLSYKRKKYIRKKINEKYSHN